MSYEGPGDRCCTFSPDGSTLFTGGLDGAIYLWRCVDVTVIGSLKGHTGSVTSCDLSHDGLWLASTGTDETLRIWSIAERRLVASMRVDGILLSTCWLPGTTDVCAVGEGGTYLFSFSPGGSRLTVTGGVRHGAS
ncbi:hypothetical protein DLE60_22705 [Micromonospora globispora]|nr:hypothetical protein DLE60_22705 [Micromonospora globispora]